MAGNLTFDQLKKMVAAGDIDTVLAAAVSTVSISPPTTDFFSWSKVRLPAI